MDLKEGLKLNIVVFVERLAGSEEGYINIVPLRRIWFGLKRRR